MPAAAVARVGDVARTTEDVARTGEVTYTGPGDPPSPPTLREVIAAELRARRLDDAASLANALGVLPFTAEGLLGRDDWAPETARFVINRLDLPIDAPAEPAPPSRPCLADVVGYGG